MKIRSKEELSGALDNESAWRKKEILTLKMMHGGSADPKALFLRRAGIAILYAHLEGFTKRAGDAYLQYVSRLGLRNDELGLNFLALSLSAKLREGGGSNSIECLLRATRFFLLDGQEKAVIRYQSATDTHSNLSPKVLKEIFLLLGLDYAPLEIKEKKVEALLKARNNIAHGQYLDVDAREFEALLDDVLAIFDEIRGQVEKAVEGKSYLKN